MIRQTLTIARRDFIATVFTPTFLVFLLAPLIMVGFGSLGGLGAATMAGSRVDKVRIVAIAKPDDGKRLAAADARLRTAFLQDNDAPPPLRVDTPSADPAAQARALFLNADADVAAVMYGELDHPTILLSATGSRTADFLSLIAEDALRDQTSAGKQLSHAKLTKLDRAAPIRSTHAQLAFFAVFGMFLMTLLTASQVIGTMAEERNNKVIEVLAAAVPLESVFLGKLIGMFGVALLFVTFWGTIASKITQILPAGLAEAFATAAPGIGTPLFTLLFFIYFSMAYLLLGTAFLIIGAQASTPREIQMLSLPLTFVQMAMFGLAVAAASSPDSTVALVAELFPLSSPFAMIARAANKTDLWVHPLAIAWQLLWVSVLIVLGARWFRRGVLKSGSGPKRRRAQPAIA
jgi:ABC-2 type transport system permease protein